MFVNQTGLADPARRFITARPLALAAICYAVGAAAGACANVPATVWGLCLIAASAAFLIRKRAVYMFIALAFAASWTNAALLNISAYYEGNVHIVGTVVHVNDEGGTLTLDDVKIDGRNAFTKVRVYAYNDGSQPAKTYGIGDAIGMDAETWIPSKATNPGEFDFKDWLASRGIWLCATAEGEIDDLGAGNSLNAALNSMRAGISSSIDRAYGENAALVKGILLGDKGEMPDEVKSWFQTAGIAHVLAVSGLHISCLAMALSALLRAIGLRRYTAFMITAPLLAVYVVLVGAPPSAVRALVMFCLVELARVFGRRYDSLTSVGCAFLILMAPNPLMILDAGLILSFSAVLGICALYPLLTGIAGTEKMGRVKRRIVKTICVSLAAQIGTLPATATIFGTLTPYAVLTNLVAVPVCGMTLPLIALSLAADQIFLSAGAPFTFIVNVLLNVMKCVAEKVSMIPGANIYVPAWPAWAIAAFIAACAMASPWSAVRINVKRRLIAVPLALIIATVIVSQLTLPSGLAITFMDASSADAAIIRAKGRTYLMDVGEKGTPAVDYLRYTGQKVDAVFLTHPHADHAGGLETLLASREVPLIYLPYNWDDYVRSSEIDDAINEAVKRKARLVYLSAGDEVALSDGITLRVLSPERGVDYPDANGMSMVTRIEYRDGAAVMLADVSAQYEPDTAGTCQLVKASHHGSNDGTSEFILRQTMSSAVVVTSKGGRHRLSRKFVQRVERVNAKIYHTGDCGMITAIVNPDGTLEMECFL